MNSETIKELVDELISSKELDDDIVALLEMIKSVVEKFEELKEENKDLLNEITDLRQAKMLKSGFPSDHLLELPASLVEGIDKWQKMYNWPSRSVRAIVQYMRTIYTFMGVHRYKNKIADKDFPWVSIIDIALMRGIGAPYKVKEFMESNNIYENKLLKPLIEKDIAFDYLRISPYYLPNHVFDKPKILKFMKDFQIELEALTLIPTISSHELKIEVSKLNLSTASLNRLVEYLSIMETLSDHGVNDGFVKSTEIAKLGGTSSNSLKRIFKENGLMGTIVEEETGFDDTNANFFRLKDSSSV